MISLTSAVHKRADVVDATYKTLAKIFTKASFALWFSW
jgi:hypothetical protein